MKSRLNFGRVNVATLQRIKDLRSLLTFIKLHPNSSVDDVYRKFNWSESKCSKASRDLVKCGLARVTGSGQGKAKNAICHLYSATEHGQEDIDRELPLNLRVATPKDNAALQNYKPRAERLAESTYAHGRAKRDPLDTYLMGAGIAPSIIFHRSQDATA